MRSRMTQLDLGLGPQVTETLELPDDPTAPGPLGPEALSPTIRGQVRLETILRAELGPKVMVSLTQNRATMVSFRHRRGVTYVRLHSLFQYAPLDVLGAVADYARIHPPPTEASELIDRFLELHRDLVEENRQDRLIVKPEGVHHDLEHIFEALNSTLFAGGLTSRITWSKAQRGLRRTSMRLGSYNESENVIRIHPALDQAFVPQYFVASVVFHEMLHEVHGAEEVSEGRRAVHTPAFLADERRFEHFERAQAWEKKHIKRLLRY